MVLSRCFWCDKFRSILLNVTIDSGSESAKDVKYCLACLYKRGKQICDDEEFRKEINRKEVAYLQRGGEYEEPTER